MVAYTMGIFQYFLLYAWPSPGITAEKIIAFLGEWVVPPDLAEEEETLIFVFVVSCEKEEKGKRKKKKEKDREEISFPLIKFKNGFDSFKGCFIERNDNISFFVILFLNGNFCFE